MKGYRGPNWGGIAIGVGTLLASATIVGLGIWKAGELLSRLIK